MEEKKFDRLETGHRDQVQARLLIDLFGETDDAAHLAWIDTHGKEASDVMDGESDMGAHIRDLARKGNYSEAAKILNEALGK